MSESEEYLVATVIMLGNNTLVDVPVIFATVDDTAVGTSSESNPITVCLFVW